MSGASARHVTTMTVIVHNAPDATGSSASIISMPFRFHATYMPRAAIDVIPPAMTLLSNHRQSVRQASRRKAAARLRCRFHIDDADIQVARAISARRLNLAQRIADFGVSMLHNNSLAVASL